VITKCDDPKIDTEGFSNESCTEERLGGVGTTGIRGRTRELARGERLKKGIVLLMFRHCPSLALAKIRWRRFFTWAKPKFSTLEGP
jgi:hypothetical protein